MYNMCNPHNILLSYNNPIRCEYFHSFSLKVSEEFQGLMLPGPKNMRCEVLATETSVTPLSDLPAPVTRAIVNIDDRILVIEVPVQERCLESNFIRQNSGTM